jgi:uncharacterized coiled-coil protein SlyX
MTRRDYISGQHRPITLRTFQGRLCTYAGLLCAASAFLNGQTVAQDTLAKRVEQLTAAMARTQAQVDESQRQMDEMRRQLAALQEAIAHTGPGEVDPSKAGKLDKQVDELRERQAMQESQIATHEQIKVESSSKYPVKLNGLILLNGFVNTNRVDTASTPAIALEGAGTTGASVRQTVLGLNATGPHLFGARSHADVNVDFGGGSSSSSYSGTGTFSGNMLRLRTAHATLDWDNTEAFFSYDRPLLSPDTPTSLTAVSEPALAWSGNLWTWNPQVGLTHDMSVGREKRLRAQAALIDASDAPVISGSSSTTAEQSRWPGIESRFALLTGQHESGLQLGLGGYFAPHTTSNGKGYYAWAGTLDSRLPLPARLELTGSFYRGQALGGLGGGDYKDVVYNADPYTPGTFDVRALDDVGGWAQLKQRATERLEFNLAYGMDSVPAGQLRPSSGIFTTAYQRLARNRTFTGNVIFSPSAYLLFSLEFRRLESSPVNAPTAASNIIGIAAGYKF